MHKIIKESLDNLSLENTIALEELALKRVVNQWNSDTYVHSPTQHYYEIIKKYNVERQYKK